MEHYITRRACGGFYSTVHSELCLGVIKVPSTLHLQYDNENRFTTYAQPNQEMEEAVSVVLKKVSFAPPCPIGASGGPGGCSLPPNAGRILVQWLDIPGRRAGGGDWVPGLQVDKVRA